MVKLEELRKKVKEKILLKGFTGTGKTYTAVKIAEVLLERGEKVVAVDTEDGMGKDLLKLPEELLEHLTLHICGNYNEFRKALDTLKGGDNKLVIVDSLSHLKDYARREARLRLLRDGKFYMGEKTVKIDNPDTYTLRGYQYALPNIWEDYFLGDLVHCGANIVATLMVDPLTDFTDYDGAFDIVLQMYYIDEEEKRKWKAKILKNRGRSDETVGKGLNNPPEQLTKLFKKEG